MVELRGDLGFFRVRVMAQNHIYIAKEHLFSMFPSFLTFSFDLIYMSFLAF